MSDHAAFSAARPNSSLKAPGVAIPASMTPRYVRSMPALCGVIVASFGTALVADWHRRNLAGDFGACACLPPRIPSSARGHASGLSCALRQARSSASRSAPSGLRFPSSTDPP
jgi:hypothetical protein